MPSSRLWSLATLVSDLRGALRRLASSPGLSIAALVTLALALAVNTTAFTLAHSILVKPLPYLEADRLVRLSHRTPGWEQAEAGMSTGTYFHYRDLSHAFDAMGLYQEARVNVTSDGPPERVSLALMTHTVFPMLGATPAAGRFFGIEDDHPVASTMVVLSHDFWQRRFGGDEAAVGRTIAINGREREIVGIAPAGFDFPSTDTQLWMPMRLDPNEATIGDLYLQGIGRLTPSTTPVQAEGDLASLVPLLTESYQDLSAEQVAHIGLQPRVESYQATVIADARVPLLILLATAVLILLITCANLANLFLVRADHRRQELAVRAALGAGRGDLARYFLSESLILVLMATGVALALTNVAIRLLTTLGPDRLPRLHELHVDGISVAILGGLGLLAVLLLSAIPILRVGRHSALTRLRSRGRGFSTSSEGMVVRKALMVSQVATATLLLITAGLLLRSAWRLASVDPGFRADGVLTVGLTLSYRDYPRFADASGFYRDLIERVRVLPGVTAVGAVSTLPLDGQPASMLEMPLEREEDGGSAAVSSRMVRTKFVTPGYFETMGIPWRDGRGVRVGDRVGTDRPVVVNAALARQLFPSGTAVGQRVRRAIANDDTDDTSGGAPSDVDAPWNTIVAVVGNVREASLEAPEPPMLYLPVLDETLDAYLVPRGMSLAVRTTLPPTSLAPAIRSLVWDQDPNLPVARVRALDEVVLAASARTRFVAQLLLGASLIALVLGALGVYSVLSFVVSRRRHEIGVRIALGARARDVSRMVVLQGIAVVAIGLSIGTGAALYLTRHLGDLLYGISPTDPLTFAATLGVLLVVALVAIYLPARRAANVDPIETLDAG